MLYTKIRHVPYKNCPKWINDISKEVCKKYGIKIKGVKFVESWDPHGQSGGWDWHKGIVFIAGSKSYDNVTLYVLLHELAHQIHFQTTDVIKRIWDNKRRDFHTKEFFKIALTLYEEYGIVRIAANHEYDRGRRYILKQSFGEQNEKV